VNKDLHVEAVDIDREAQGLWDLAHQVYAETSSAAARQAARDEFIERELLTAEELDGMGLTLAAGLAVQRQSSLRSSGPRSFHARW
jgi:hypothetical protein